MALLFDLYDGGRKKNLAAATRAEAAAVDAEHAQRAKEHHDLQQNTEAAQHQLVLQQEISQRSLATAQKEAALIERNYRAGAALYLEVQRATTRVLEFRTALLRLKAEEIALVAMLQFLSAESSLPASAPSEKKS
jgi:outer membrane protein TolC